MPQQAEATGRILIIPSDPVLISRSTGDQAMIGAILNEWRRRMPGAAIYIATASAEADAAVEDLGIVPLLILEDMGALAESLFASLAIKPDVVILMGADGVDGSYDPSFSVRNLALVDLLSRSGAQVYITGFSVSRDLHPLVTTVFDEIDATVAVNVRDPVSYARFTDACECSARKVADVAFLLKPEHSQRVESLVEWIEGQRSQGRTVIGLNFHPLLLALEQRSDLEALINAMAQVVDGLLQSGKISILLIDHDARGPSSDAHCLLPLFEKLVSRHSGSLVYPRDRLAAAEIKALASLLGGIISGRMHLMIASIGATTPVFGIDYKDKMEGVLQLCGLEAEHLTDAASIVADPAAFKGQIVTWIADLERQRTKVSTALPSIAQSAMRNFSPSF